MASFYGETTPVLLEHRSTMPPEKFTAGPPPGPPKVSLKGALAAIATSLPVSVGCIWLLRPGVARSVVTRASTPSPSAVRFPCRNPPRGQPHAIGNGAATDRADGLAAAQKASQRACAAPTPTASVKLDTVL